MMLAAQAVEDLLLRLSKPVQERELVPVADSLGRVLAEPIGSAVDFPHWDNSAMDGYAVRWDDVVAQVPPAPQSRRSLTVIEEIPAGFRPQKSLARGEAARIFTGAMLPIGADTILIQEHTQRNGDQVEILQVPSQRGEFVRYRGDYAKAGQVLVAAGVRMNPATIAVAAAAQCPQVWVYRRPQVAIFSTGDELVNPTQPLAAGQIVDSNQPAIAALVRQWGGEPICLGIVPDRPAELQELMTRAIATADLVISTGGVSVGDYDYVEQMLGELGGELQVTSVAIKPGKPLTLATFQRFARGDAPRTNKSVLFFGLPGNPVSALVGCWRFVYLSFQGVAGVAEPQLPWFTAVSGAVLRGDSRRDCLLWGRVTATAGQMTFLPVAGGHNSGNLINLALANALALVTVEQGAVAEGEAVPILWLSL
jgi:molybdopterin molybdotransferase